MDQAPDALLQSHAGNPIEVFLGTARVAIEVRHVERPRRGLHDGRLSAGEFNGQRRQPAKRGRPAGEQMDGRRHLSFRQQLDEGDKAADRIVEVGEVEDVVLAFHAQGAPPCRGASECRHDAVGVVAGAAVYVGKPDDGGAQACGPGRLDESLALCLAPPVYVDGTQRRVLGDGEMIRLPIDFAAAGEEQPRPPRRFDGCLDDIAQTADVDVPADLRSAFPPHDAGDRGEMDDAAAAGDRIPDAPGLPHVAGFAT